MRRRQQMCPSVRAETKKKIMQTSARNVSSAALFIFFICGNCVLENASREVERQMAVGAIHNSVANIPMEIEMREFTLHGLTRDSVLCLYLCRLPFFRGSLFTLFFVRCHCNVCADVCTDIAQAPQHHGFIFTNF
jgi:hypothetical protein